MATKGRARPGRTLIAFILGITREEIEAADLHAQAESL